MGSCKSFMCKHDRERKDAEIARLRKDKALLVELVMDGELKPMTKCCIATVIRDGGLAPTPLVTAWVDKVVARLNQQLPSTEKSNG